MDVISMRDFSRVKIDSLIDAALDLKQNGINHSFLKNKKVASLFFENSTRTRISSETAATDLCCTVNGFSGAEGTSVKKGEPLIDTVRMFAGYGHEAVIMRHSLEGSARFAADHLPVSIVNGGDGSNGHPTQTLLDLMTIKEIFSKIDGLKIALVGDLKYGRTVHSLLQALALYQVEVWLISPKELEMPFWRVQDYRNSTEKDVLITSALDKAIKEVDVLYMTRIQRERFPEGIDGEKEYQRVSSIYNLKAEMLKEAKNELIIMHPLPRYKHNLEISMDVDKTKHAKYFQQAENGRFMRQAVLQKVFSEAKSKTNGKEEDPVWQDLPIINGNKKGERLIYRLDNGMLIDHLEQGKGLVVYKLLRLKNFKEITVVPALNIKSRRQGRKDVLAIHNFELTPKQLSRIALISPDATINIIRDQQVVKKGKVILPKVIEELVLCDNHNCISNPEHHEHAVSKFHVESKEPLRLRCHYCEKPLCKENIRLIY